MKEFISKKSNPDIKEPDIRVTDNYIEAEFPGDGAESTYIYIVPKSENQALVLAALDDAILELISTIDENNREIIFDTWPVFSALLHNGIKDKYSEGALVLLDDYDNGDKTAFVSTIVGNLNLKPTKKGIFGRKKITLFTPEMADAMKLVLSKASDLYEELANKRPGFWKTHKGGILNTLGSIASTLAELYIYS